MLFKKNSETEKAINTLYNNLRGSVKYNDRISWKELEELTGIKPDRETLYYICQRVNNLLMRHDRMFMETVHDFGKRIIRPDEHSVVARKKVQHSVRVYRKAGAIIAATNMDDLSEEQKKQLESDAKKWQTLELFHTHLIQNKTSSKKVDKDAISNEDKAVLDMIKLLKS